MPEPILTLILKTVISPLTKLGEAIFGSYQKTRQQPTLSIRLEFGSSSRMTRGLSPNNNFPPEGEAIFVGDLGKMNHYYDLSWRYDMFITNDSEYTAFQLHPAEHVGIKLTFKPHFDYTKPIQPNETIQYEMTASVNYFEGTYFEADERVHRGPIDEFQIEYTNAKKKVTFYTRFRPTAKDVRDKNVHGRLDEL